MSTRYSGTVMADRNSKADRNVPGKYYVDTTCVDCDLCRQYAPESMRRDEETGTSYVFHQPATAEQIAAAEEALQSCPTESIGKDG
jgi:ferredoxin